MSKKEHNQLIESYLKEISSESEMKQLRLFLQNDPGVASFIEREIGAAEDQFSTEQTNRVLQSIKQKSGFKSSFSADRLTSRIRIHILRVAVVLFFSFFSAFSMYYYLKVAGNSTTSSPLVIKVDRGQKANLLLPDGSKVWLNSDSQLSYQNDFNANTRTLHLNGEGYFEVKRDMNRPFQVITKDMTIEVLGTSFGIKAYEDDRLIYASLVKGAVKLQTSSGETVLRPNDRFIFDRHRRKQSVIEDPHIEDFVGWKENRMRFNNQTLEEIVKQLERRYNIKVHFSSDKLKTFRFTGTINNNSIESVFHILSLTSPIIYDMKSDMIVLYEDSNRLNLYH